MVTGGLAAILYGDPRLTNDVDVVLDLDPADVGRIVAAFPTPEYYVPPIETLREEASRDSNGHFNVLHTDTAIRADIYLAGRDSLMAWGLERHRTVTVAGEPVSVAPIEYVILKKLEYYRASGSDRHLRDIAAMRRLSGELIDSAALDAWLGRLDLRAEWELVSREA